MIMHKFLRVIQICLLGYLGLNLGSCSKNEKSQVTVEVVDGVTFVSNPEQGLWGDAGEMHLQEVLTIESEGTNVELLFIGINDIEVDVSGRIYICDFKGNAIKIFSPEGKLLRSIGTRGSGPGELWAPSGIAMGPGNRIYVREKGNLRVSIFSTEGKYVNSFKIELPGASQDLLVNPVSGDVYLTSIHYDTTVFVYNEIGRLQQRFAEVPLWGTARLKRNQSSAMHSPVSMTFLHAKNFLTALNYPYEIHKYSWDGQLEAKINTACSFFLPPYLLAHEMGLEVFILRGGTGRVFSLSSNRILVTVIDSGEDYIEDYTQYIERTLKGSAMEVENRDPTKNWRYYYDLYDEQGRFLKRFPNPIKNKTIKYIDHDDNAYFVNKRSELPGLTKYKLSFSR